MRVAEWLVVLWQMKKNEIRGGLVVKIVTYEQFPECAKEIREAVFVKEQGFIDEFDETDAVAVHIVLFDDAGLPAGTCRVFWDEERGSYILGRLAVVKEHRGEQLGSAIVQEAERYVQKMKGAELALHAQCTASAFYQKLGYVEFGEIEAEQGCPHVWMKKNLRPF